MTYALAPGSTVGRGRFVVGEEINRGGTAIVYEGYDNALKMRVALKVMDVSQSGGHVSVPLQAVKREIKYATKLSQTRGGEEPNNIVRLLCVVDEADAQGTCAILIQVYELIVGVDMLDFLNLRQGRLSENEARRYFKQLLGGVECIHANGFCHRDIKPENCMIETETDTLKIIDFGLSKHLESAKTVGIGTPDYMSPEMLCNASALGMPPLALGGDGRSPNVEYDPAAVDVWSMGVMLYLMVSGTYPFEDANSPGNISATLSRIKSGKMNELPSTTSPFIQDLIQKMMQANPAKRITLGEIANHPWVVGVKGDSSRYYGASTAGDQSQSLSRHLKAALNIPNMLPTVKLPSLMKWSSSSSTGKTSSTASSSK